MLSKIALLVALFSSLVRASGVLEVEKRQSCPAGQGYFPLCGKCCPDTYPASCYEILSGPQAGTIDCFDSPPGDIVSTASNSYSASYAATTSSQAYSEEPYESAGYSSVAASTTSAPYPSATPAHEDEDEEYGEDYGEEYDEEYGEYSTSSAGYGYSASTSQPYGGGSPTVAGSSVPSASQTIQSSPNRANRERASALELALGVFGLVYWL